MYSFLKRNEPALIDRTRLYIPMLRNRAHFDPRFQSIYISRPLREYPHTVATVRLCITELLMTVQWREIEYVIHANGMVQPVTPGLHHQPVEGSYAYIQPIEEWVASFWDEFLSMQRQIGRGRELKEALAAAVWHPHRVESMIEKYGIDTLDCR